MLFMKQKFLNGRERAAQSARQVVVNSRLNATMRLGQTQPATALPS